MDVEGGEAGRVDEDVHRPDPPVLDGEGADRVQVSVEQRDPAGRGSGPEGWKFTERVYEIGYIDTSPLPGTAPEAAGGAR